MIRAHHYRGDSFLAVRGASGGLGSSDERPVLVFQCYLDDSGTSGLPIVTMAGFVASLQIWERLEPKLDAIMSSNGVPILHTKEFHDTRPPFKGWSKIRKRSFADELFAAAHGSLYGLSVTIRKSDYLKGVQGSTFDNMSPMAACFSSIMTRLVMDTQIGPAIKLHGIAFLIETGNKNNAEIEQFFHKVSKFDVFGGRLRSMSFIPKSHCRAIQLADFLAFYSRRLMRNHDRFSGKLALPACAYLDIIKKHGPVWQMGGFGQPKATNYRIDKMQDITVLRPLLQEQFGRRPSQTASPSRPRKAPERSR